MEKSLTIIRGISGSGKSSVARLISDTVFEADQYFYQNIEGEYKFDASQLGAAHKWCQGKVRMAMELGTSKIVVSNTSTRESDVELYRQIAKEYGYTSFVLTVENWHGGVDIHSVPKEALERQETQLRQSIKLR